MRRIYLQWFTMHTLHPCSKNKAVAILKELDSEGGIGLVEKKRQGQGKPTIIYVKNFASREFLQNCNNWDSAQNRGVSESHKINLLNPTDEDLRSVRFTILESQNMGANNTNIMMHLQSRRQ